MKTSKDLKNEKKELERAAKAEEEKKKEIALQASIVEEFNAKQEAAKAAADPVAKLKCWLKDPPYKSSDDNLKVSTIQPLNIVVHRKKPSTLFSELLVK